MAVKKVIVKMKDGVIQNKLEIKHFFSDLKDGNFQLELDTVKKRSNPQNNYYWGLVVPMIKKGIEALGTELTIAETHEFLKAKFNTVEIINAETGQVEALPKSTSRLSPAEFNGYKEKIQRFASEFLNIYIPDPNEQMEMNYDG